MSENKKPERDEKGRLLPGNTANPNGRPRAGHTIRDLMLKIGETQTEVRLNGKRQKVTLLEALIERAYTEAINGSAPHARLIAAYIDGYPKQHHELSGTAEGGPVTFKMEMIQIDTLQADAGRNGGNGHSDRGSGDSPSSEARES